VFLEDLLAPLPGFLREVDRGPEVLGGERAFRFREGGLRLRQISANSFGEPAQGGARIDDPARAFPVDALPSFERLARLVHGDFVVLGRHRPVRFGEGFLRFDDVRVRPAGLIDQVLRRLDAILGGLAGPRGLFDLLLELLAQLAVPQVPAHVSSAPLPRGDGIGSPQGMANLRRSRAYKRLSP